MEKILFVLSIFIICSCDTESTQKKTDRCKTDYDCTQLHPLATCNLNDMRCESPHCESGEILTESGCVPISTGCTTHAQCSSSQPLCLTDQGRCVECLIDADCPDSNPVCHPEEYRCIRCTQEKGCNQTWQFCNGDRCEAIYGRCDTNDTCPSNTPICELETHTCRQMTTSEISTIYELRTIAQIDSDPQISDRSLGKIDHLKGVVIAVKESETHPGVYVQQQDQVAYGGIFVDFDEILDQLSNYQIGDLIEFSGKHIEYFGFSQIVPPSPSDIIKISSNHPIPAPLLLETTELDESYESLLVQIKGDRFIIGTCSSGNTTISVETEQFLIRPSIYQFTLSFGEQLSQVKGIMGSYKDAPQLQPRGATDLLPLENPCSIVICDSGYLCENGTCVAEQTENTLERCQDQLDNDNDQATDCQDDGCQQFEHCKSSNLTSIYNIRTGTVSENSPVQVKGIVTGIKLTDDLISGVYIQEAGDQYRGIYLYITTPGTIDLNIGDEIIASGNYLEYYGLSEITLSNIQSIQKTGKNSPIIQYQKIIASKLSTTQYEQYEGMLVTLTGPFTVSGTNTLIDQENHEIALRSILTPYTLTTGEIIISLKGILTYHYNTYKILPQSGDLVKQDQLCSTVECDPNMVCMVISSEAECVCDQNSGYYEYDGGCKNPCIPSNPCTESHKNSCTPTSAVSYECSCSPGFVPDGSICTELSTCDATRYQTAFNKKGDALISALHEIVKNQTVLSYNDAKEAMFGYIDNESGVVRGVYSGDYYEVPYGGMPDQTKFNCEHSWPQSKFEGIPEQNTAKSDIHHLFPTYMQVNSTRSNNPFGTINSPYAKTFGSGDYISKYYDQRFEPADQHKGDVARAMLYFMVRYSNPYDFINYAGQREILLEWNKLDPVSTKEQNRNDAIEEYQHNRNPFIDCPYFIDALFEQ